MFYNAKQCWEFSFRQDLPAAARSFIHKDTHVAHMMERKKEKEKQLQQQSTAGPAGSRGLF